MKRRFKYATVAIAAMLMIGGCATTPSSDDNIIYTSILPVRYIVEEIVGDDFDVKVLVPPGASPETYEPTPKEYISLNEAAMIFSIGLIDFEQSILGGLSDKNKLVELSRGVDVIAGSCSHNHSHGAHSHGVDPHIWTSPIELQQMAHNCYEAINKIYPDSTHYFVNYQKLQLSLEELDQNISGKIMTSGIKSFVIHHPAYTYFARDYNLEQIAIEDEGKEPSTRRIGSIIERAKAEGVTKILYQNQLPSTVVDVIASDMGVEAVEVDPLREDVVAAIEEFTNIITSK